jgi:Protein of unknown function (DUF2946)
MAKWPKVPALSGWLTLTRRGLYLLQGEEVRHPASRAFIAANYARDPEGRYFFQNGPQRVYVTLERTPWIYRLDGAGGITTHTGLTTGTPSEALIDEEADLYLLCEPGIGMVHDSDLSGLELEARNGATWIGQGNWRLCLTPILRANLPTRFSYISAP